MNQYFEKVKSGNTGVLSIGSGTYYCTYFLPDLIRNFRALYPGVQMVLSEGSSKQTYQMLLDGKLDFTLDVNENDDPSLDHVVIARENMILAIPESFSCNDKLRDCRCSFDDILRGVHLGESVPPVDMSCLRDEPFILTKPGNHSRDLMLALCRKSGFEPKSVLDMDQLLTAYYVACEGMGITIVRDTSLRHVAHSSKLCFYRLPPELSVRNIYLSFQKKRARASADPYIYGIRSGPGTQFRRVISPLLTRALLPRRGWSKAKERTAAATPQQSVLYFFR